MAITRDPNPVSKGPVAEKKGERAVESFINKGGSTTLKARKERDGDKIKSFRLDLTESEVDMIKTLRDMRPRSVRSRKIIISVNDWVIEAVNEKIEREKKKYNVD